MKQPRAAPAEQWPVSDALESEGTEVGRRNDHLLEYLIERQRERVVFEPGKQILLT